MGNSKLSKLTMVALLGAFLTACGDAEETKDKESADGKEEKTEEVVAETKEDEATTEETTEEAEVEEEVKTEALVQEEPPAVKTLNTLKELVSDGKAFDTGDFIKGDIPKGDYVYIQPMGVKGYYSEEDASGNIIDNERFDSVGYVTVHGVGNISNRGVLVHVNDIEKLGVKSGKELFEVLNATSGYNGAGYYKVGSDIPAGTYVFESLAGHKGYVAIMSGGIGDSDIIDNDRFDGRYSLTVKDGQYLKVSNSTFTLQ